MTLETIQITKDDKTHSMNIALSGRVDSITAPEVAKKLEKALEGYSSMAVVVDAEKLGYISSAGLRVLLDLKKVCDDMKVINVSLDIYDILTMTGFTKFIDVERRIRKIRQPAPGELISSDTDSKLYRSINELAVRVFDSEVSLEEVQRRFQLSKTVTAYGIPTPIAFEIVSCNDCYGIIFERTHGKTLDKIWEERPDNMQEELKLLSDLMKTLHSCRVEKKELPDYGKRMIDEIEKSPVLSDEDRYSLKHLVESLNATETFIYGNLRLSNVLLQDGKLLLMDLSRCGRGNPILDLQTAVSAQFADRHGTFWKKLFARYTQNMSDDKRALLERILKPGIRPWW